MSDKRKHVDPIPDEFTSYEEAAEFWDTHDTTDYLNEFQTVDLQPDFRARYFEIEVDEEVMVVLWERAQKLGTTVNRLANDLLRQQILPTAS
ncbi:MAG: CopG family antitoxin [Chloroflexota bacterium]